MPKLKSFDLNEPRAHRFLSGFAHHVGEEKFEDNGHRSQFHKKHYGYTYYDEPVESDLARAARIEKEKKENPTKKHWWE